MQLRIKKIKIDNFKAIPELTIFPDSSFNIIVGENNAGKSTIFEAMHLWEKCYRALIQTNRKDFYNVGGNKRYLSYQSLDFLRITVDSDLFNKSPHTAKITMTFCLDRNDFDLGVSINKPSSLRDSFFRVAPIKPAEFINFAEAVDASETGKKLDELIFLYQTRPVAGILQREPYYNEVQIKKKVLQGQSHEVLRNKIIQQRGKQDELKSKLSAVLDEDITFEFPKPNRREKDEYINLKVLSKGKKLDIHLQGSGFLQIAEIVSSIEYIDAPLKILLVDEPDSHIHTKLQSNLLKCLREIDNNQFFVISHNDQFVNNAKEGEVFFLNEQSKSEKELKPLPQESFDKIKNELGGVILALDRLNYCERIIFVEGDDDANYVHMLMEAFHRVKGSSYKRHENVFIPTRGKDNIYNKLEYNRRTMGGLFRGKSFGVIFDADYCTQEIDQSLKTRLQKVLGQNAFAYSHKGYCIEGTLFSDINILAHFISHLREQEVENVRQEIDAYFQNMRIRLSTVGSELSGIFKGRFKSQKENRPEIADLDFDDYLADVLESGDLSRVMCKPEIRNFTLHIESLFGELFDRSEDYSDEALACGLYARYLDFIQDEAMIYPSFLELITKITGQEETVEAPQGS